MCQVLSYTGDPEHRVPAWVTAGGFFTAWTGVSVRASELLELSHPRIKVKL